MKTEFTFIRHGQTNANVAKLYTCDTDLLTDTGIKQAQTAGEKLKDKKFDACFYGTTNRVVCTANIVLSAIECTPKTINSIKDVREINFGSFSGHTADENEKKFPTEWASYMADFTNFCFPNGESFADFYENTKKIIMPILSHYEGKKVLFIASKGFIITAISILKNEDVNSMFSYDIKNADPYTLII